MSDTIVLGREPDELDLLLIASDPFACVLRQFDKPAGTPGRQPVNWTAPPTLEFPGAGAPPWVSTTAGNEATFAIPSADVDALLATGERDALLTVGGVVWAVGKWRSKW